MKILVSGGAGFIGYHLTKRLLHDSHKRNEKNGENNEKINGNISEKNNKVVIADNFSRGVNDSYLSELGHSVTLRSVDLMNEASLKTFEDDYDQIYHLAAIIGVQNVLSKPYSVLRDNVLLLTNMIELARRQKHLQRFIFTSTSEIYAGTLQYYGLSFPTKEDTPLSITALEHPRTSYMLSKIYGEALLNQSGLNYTIIRPHNFYGPRMGMSHVIPELLKKAYFGKETIDVYSVEHRRTFCYIDDAVEMIVRLANNPEASGMTFNIGNEKPEVTMMQVAEAVLNVTNRKDLKINSLPPSPGSPERRCPSIEKAKQYSKYEPIVALDEGIRKTYEWYKQNIFEGNEICEK